MESFEKLLKQEIFERFYKLSSKKAIKVLETFKVKQSRERNISEKYHVKGSLTVFRCFPKKQKFF